MSLLRAQKWSVLTTLLILPIMLVGQESNLGNWLIYIGSKKIDSRWNFHHEIQYRNYNVAGDLEQLLIRGGLGYNLSESNNNLLLGYGFIHSQNYIGTSDEKVNVDEHRIFQQFITKQKLGQFGLQHRYRFEQRFVADDFRLRFRYFLGITHPITFFGEGDKQTKLYFSAYNELFIGSKVPAFDRNRLYLGLGYDFQSGQRVELGYMNQFLSGRSRDQINMILFANF